MTTPVAPDPGQDLQTTSNNNSPMTSGTTEAANKQPNSNDTKASSQQPPSSEPSPNKPTTNSPSVTKTSSQRDVSIQQGDGDTNAGAEDCKKENNAAAQSSEKPSSSNIGDHSVVDILDNKASAEEDRANKANVAAEKVLSVSANLAKLLPSGAVLVFQTLSASFTNQGSCNTANRWLSGLLVAFLTAACIFLTFTDSIVYKKKIYYGVALPRRLNVFALSRTEEKQLFRELGAKLKERRLKALDWVHAFFTAIVFLSIAMGDVGLQKCFVPRLDVPEMKNVKELLRNAPLGLALLSSFVFMIFPTTRHGVGFDNSNRDVTDPDDAKQNAGQQQAQKENNINQTAKR